MTPPPDPVAALAEALDTPAIFEDMLDDNEALDIATALHDALTAAGWSLVRQEERDVLERVAAAAAVIERLDADMASGDRWVDPMTLLRIALDDLDKARVAAASGRVCARYHGSDGMLCSTHSRRFASPSDVRCAALAPSPATEAERRGGEG